MCNLEWLEVSAPSIDRPFGIHLWGILEHVFTNYLGRPASSINFDDKTLPMTSWQEMLAGIVTYYVVIFGGREVMKGLSPIRLNWLFQLHNFILTVLSFVLLLLLAEQEFPMLYRHGLFYTMCAHQAWTKPTVAIYYLNYLTKYYEFIDTVFLVLRKKPLTFLHTYHHGATAMLCFFQGVGHTPISWVPIILNLAVHSVMYLYYLLCSFKIYPSWKILVTQMQITQFVLDLIAVYFASWTYFTSTYWPWLPNYGNCAGEEYAAISGCVILTSYLFLFIAFYFKVYKKQPKDAKAALKPQSEKGPLSAAARATYSPSPSPAPSTGPKKVSKSKKT